MQQAAVNLPSTVSVGNETVRIQERLGNGAFGVVYKVKDEASSMVYALKDVLCLNDSALRNAVREATTLNKISHGNVIAIMGADQFRDTQGRLHMLLLTEYCSGGSLNERLAQPSSEEMNMKWISQIAGALAHLHSQGVVHRDLKADNVLLTATEDVKLADFGLAREYTALKNIFVPLNDGSWLTIYTQYYMSSGIGPIHWVAPEFFTGHYTEKADVFSLGTLIVAIQVRDSIVIDGKRLFGAFVDIPGVGKLGFGSAMYRLRYPHGIGYGIRPDQFTEVFNPLVDVFERTPRVAIEALQYNGKNRPSAQEVYDKAMYLHQAEAMYLHQAESSLDADDFLPSLWKFLNSFINAGKQDLLKNLSDRNRKLALALSGSGSSVPEIADSST